MRRALLLFVAVCMLVWEGRIGATHSLFHSRHNTRNRLLQQGIENAANPTGRNMRTEVDFPAKTEVLTVKLVNEISKQAGLDTSGNALLTGPYTDNDTENFLNSLRQQNKTNTTTALNASTFINKLAATPPDKRNRTQ